MKCECVINISMKWKIGHQHDGIKMIRMHNLTNHNTMVKDTRYVALLNFESSEIFSRALALILVF